MTDPADFFDLYRQGFARIAVAVPRCRVADPAFNAGQSIALLRQAARQGAAVVLFPELGLSAYTCDDLFHQHALLSRHVDSLKLFLGFGVLGVGFQALLDVVELGLHVALKAFKELNTGLAQLAVAHNTRHIHNCHLGLCVVVGLLAGKKHEAQQQSQRHNKTNSHGCNHSSQNMAGQWFGGLGVDEHVLCFYRHYNHFSRKLPHQRPIFRPLLIGVYGQRSEAY